MNSTKSDVLMVTSSTPAMCSKPDTGREDEIMIIGTSDQLRISISTCITLQLHLQVFGVQTSRNSSIGSSETNAIEIFVYNTNRTFLSNIDIKGF